MNNAMNKTPEQKARDWIDAILAAGWALQGKAPLDFGADREVAVRDYPTDNGTTEDVSKPATLNKRIAF